MYADQTFQFLGLEVNRTDSPLTFLKAQVTNKGTNVLARRDHLEGFPSNECKKHTQEASWRDPAHAYRSALSSILFSRIFIGFSVW